MTDSTKQSCCEKGDFDCMRANMKLGWFCSIFSIDNSYLTHEICTSFNPVGCGLDFSIGLNKDVKTIEKDISLNYGEGCSYSVTSTCGFPNMTMDTTALDVAVALYADATDPGEDPTLNYPFESNETMTYLAATGTPKNFTFRYPGYDDNSTATCTAIRKAYITITNVVEPKPVV